MQTRVAMFARHDLGCSVRFMRLIHLLRRTLSIVVFAGAYGLFALGYGLDRLAALIEGYDEEPYA